MLTTVEARTAAGTLLTLSLEDVTDGLIVDDVEGLDPVKAAIVMSAFATMDGEQYQSSRREPRYIIIKLDLLPDYNLTTVQDLRNKLYEFFMPPAPVSLRFIDSGGLEVDIDGRVEFCGAPLFTKDPKANISIICPKPDLIDITPVELSGNTVSTTTETLIDYVGTVKTGIEFSLNVDRTLSDFTIYHRAPDNTITSFEIIASLLADDILTINTIPGSRGITLNRGGTLSSLLYSKTAQSKFDNLMLSYGDNYIRVYAVGAAIPYDLTYLNRYGGI